METFSGSALRWLRRSALAFTVMVAASVLLAVTAAAVGASMTLTFVRHAESVANATGVIDSKVPGPDLTELGRQQAAAVAELLQHNGYDGFYASDMVRTQQTAAPLLALLADTGDPHDLTVLPGLHEIDAGIFEGSSADSGLGRIGYVLAPVLWTLGARLAPLPGSSDADGNAFDERVDGAVRTIYNSGDHNAVAFAHSATIMFWVLMNVENPDLGLLLTHQLGNTESVVINGNPDDGWTLVSWAGQQVNQKPSFVTQQFVNFRDWVTAPQSSLYNVSKALRTGDLGQVVAAIGDGVVNIVVSTVKFVGAVIGDTVQAVSDLCPAPAHAAAAVGAVAEQRRTSGTDADADADADEAPDSDVQDTAVHTDSPHGTVPARHTSPDEIDSATADAGDDEAADPVDSTPDPVPASHDVSDAEDDSDTGAVTETAGAPDLHSVPDTESHPESGSVGSASDTGSPSSPAAGNEAA